MTELIAAGVVLAAFGACVVGAVVAAIRLSRR